MSGYKVRYMHDDLLSGRDWVLCNQHDDGVTLYIRQGVRRLPDAEMETILEEAWAGFRNLAHVDEIPRQRVSV